MRYAKSFLLSFLLLSSHAFAQSIYTISCSQQNDSLRVRLNYSYRGSSPQANYLLLSSCCSIGEMNIKEYSRSGDTLWFQQPVYKLIMDYSVPVDLYRTSDSAICLRREGNWYPHRNGELLTAVVSVEDSLHYVLGGENVGTNGFFANNAIEIHLIFLPKTCFRLEVQESPCRLFCFYRSTLNTTPHDEAFYSEFVDSYSFFSRFFGDTLSHQPMSVVEISDPQFQMCQSLPGLILFGSNFFEIYKMMPLCSWIPHEVAHQWWGNSLMFPHLDYALSESVNEYLKLLYLRDRKRGYKEQLQLYQGNIGMATKHLAIADIHNVQDMDASIAIYSDAPLRLWNLAKKGSNSGFNAMLASIYRNNRHTIITRSEFISSMPASLQKKFQSWLAEISPAGCSKK